MTDVKEQREEITLQAESDQPAAPVAPPVVLRKAQDLNMFDGLQPPRKARPKTPRLSSSGPPPSWRRWFPTGIAALSVLAVLYCWSTAHFTGEERLSMGNLRLAIESYTRDAAVEAKAHDPSSANHLALAQIYLKKNMLADSIKYAEEGLTITKNRYEAQQLHQIKGMAQLKRSEWERATSEFEKSKPKTDVKLDYSDKELLRTAQIGQLIASTHLKNTDANDRLLKELRPKPDDGWGLDKEARYMFLAGRTGAARDILEQELARKGAKIESWQKERIEMLLGDIALAQHDYKSAVTHYNTTSDGNDCTLLDKRSRAHKGLGNLDAYRSDQRKLTEKHDQARQREIQSDARQSDYALHRKYFQDHDEDMIKNELGSRYPDLRHIPSFDD